MSSSALAVTVTVWGVFHSAGAKGQHVGLTVRSRALRALHANGDVGLSGWVTSCTV